MKIIDDFYCQAKIFYAGGSKLQNGLSLFKIAEGMQDKFPNLIISDSYSNNEALAFDRSYIVDAKKYTKWNKSEKMLVNDLYELFIETENGFYGKPTYNIDAEYFVIHNGECNHD